MLISPVRTCGRDVIGGGFKKLERMTSFRSQRDGSIVTLHVKGICTIGGARDVLAY